MVLFKPKSDQVTPLTLSSVLPNQREGQTPPVSGTALMPFAHPVPDTLAFLFLQDARDLPASGLLYLLFPLPGMPFPHAPKRFPLLLPPRPFLAPLYQISPPPSQLAFPTFLSITGSTQTRLHPQGLVLPSGLEFRLPSPPPPLSSCCGLLASESPEDSPSPLCSARAAPRCPSPGDHERGSSWEHSRSGRMLWVQGPPH